MWSLKTSGMEALAGYWALENPVADRLKPRFRVHLEFLKPVVEGAAAAAVGERGRELTVAHLDHDPMNYSEDNLRALYFICCKARSSKSLTLSSPAHFRK